MSKDKNALSEKAAYKKAVKKRERDLMTAAQSTDFLLQSAVQRFQVVDGYPAAEVKVEKEKDEDPKSEVLWAAWVTVGGLKRFAIAVFLRNNSVFLHHNWIQPQEISQEFN